MKTAQRKYEVIFNFNPGIQTFLRKPQDVELGAAGTSVCVRRVGNKQSLCSKTLQRKTKDKRQTETSSIKADGRGKSNH